MELFGLMFAFPVTLVTSVVYCYGAASLFTKLRLLQSVAFAVSLSVALCILIEIILLITLGAKPTYAHLGVGFTVVHEVSFWLGPPAIANLLLILCWLRHDIQKPPKTAIVSVVCWFACMCALLGNISVDEAIVGIDADVPFYMTDPSSLTLE